MGHPDGGGGVIMTVFWSLGSQSAACITPDRLFPGSETAAMTIPTEGSERRLHAEAYSALATVHLDSICSGVRSYQLDRLVQTRQNEDALYELYANDGNCGHFGRLSLT